MQRDFYNDAVREADAREAMRRWVRARVEAIRNRITAHDVLRRNGVQLRYGGDREEQISCPFHGIDRKPSARVYTETARSPSHVWCFVCQQHWDCIGLWKKFTGEEKFTRALAEMEKAYGILPPERPPTPAEMEDYEDPEVAECERLFATCESLLINSRPAFDMKGYLMIGSILDRTRYYFEQTSFSTEKTKTILQQVLTKITEKERAYVP